MKKAQELWAALSKDEPENQARPQTVEQLIVMITRETARRLVHLINHTSSRMTKLPNQINRTARGITIQFLHVADTLVKVLFFKHIQPNHPNKQLEHSNYRTEKSTRVALNRVSRLHFIILGFIDRIQNSN